MNTAFETVYVKKGKHRKRCWVCNKLIQDGEKASAVLRQEKKIYPVKGIMFFSTWKFRHTECKPFSTN